MKADHEWLFFYRAAWNIDQATAISKTLIEDSEKKHSDSDRVIRSAAYNFCIVSYCSPFMGFRTATGKEKGLNKERYIPRNLVGLHEQVINYRDKILAHTDIEHLSAPDFKQGYRFASSTTCLEAPPIEEAFKLFSAVSDLVIKKLNTLDGK